MKLTIGVVLLLTASVASMEGRAQAQSDVAASNAKLFLAKEITGLRVRAGAVDHGALATSACQGACRDKRTFADPHTADLVVLDEHEQLTAATLAPVSKDKAVSVAHEVVASVIAPKLQLSAGEAAVFDHVLTKSRGSLSIKDNRVTTEVLGYRVAFRREIDGVPVIGPGSGIAVEVLVNGRVGRIQYRWPLYERTERRALVSAAQLAERVSTVQAARRGAKLARSAEKAVAAAVTNGTQVGLANRKLHGFKCGYLDDESRSTLPVGCAYREEGVTGDDGFAAIRTVSIESAAAAPEVDLSDAITGPGAPPGATSSAP